MPHNMKLRPRTPVRKGSQYAAQCRTRVAASTGKWSRRFVITTAVVLVVLLARATYTYFTHTEPGTIAADSSDGEEESYYTGRTLQSTDSNGSTSQHHGAAWERCDFEKAHYRYVFLLPYIFLILSLFIGVAIICDDFFVPSLEAISEKLDLSEDVAGATFMAAGSSAPELFTSVAGVGVESDVGIGTIVGSAMFNILIIIALSAVLSGQLLNLDWRPLARDSLVYGLSIAVFIGFAWDGEFQWYEALILLLLYVAYIVIMKFNSYLMKLLARIECNWCRNESRIEPASSTASLSTAPVTGEEGASGVANYGAAVSLVTSQQTGGQEPVTTISYTPQDSTDPHAHHHHHDDHEKHRFVHSHRGELAGPIANRRPSTVHHHHSDHRAHSLPPIHLPTIQQSSQEDQQQITSESSPERKEEEEEEKEEEEEEEEKEETLTLLPCLPPIRTSLPSLKEALEQGKLGILKFVLHWILFVMAFPYLVAYTWTIPNCSKNRKWYVVAASFTMAILWIAIISFGMVTLVARVGCILNIGEFTMGLVVVAIGTSIPDAISSVLVARDGFGDMAVSNAIGSNVFDINLGLGLPFLIRTIIDRGRPFPLLDDELQEKYDEGELVIVPHAKFGFLLMFVLLAILGTLTIFRFRLNSFTGLCFVLLYALFLTYSFVQETICKRGQFC